MRCRIVVAALLFPLTPAAAVPDVPRDVPKTAAPAVRVSHPVQRQVTDFEVFTGRTQAVQTVDLRARATGYLIRVLFQDGAEVRQGDVLFEIDPRPYQAELDRARAGLALAEARLKLAQANAKRAKALAGTNAVGKDELDKVEAERAAAEAAVRMAHSDTEVAQLKLSFTRVTAPISGHIGRRLLDVGNLVKADDTVLAAIVSDDPMYAHFDMDERTLLDVRRAVNEGRIKMPQAGHAPLYLGLAGEEGYPHAGTLDFVNNQVDPATGTIRVRGIFPNPRPAGGVRLLSPGMFVRIRLPIGAPHPALLVSVGAVGSDQGQRFVYVLDDKDVVRRRDVKAGPLQDDGLLAITDGLKAGDWVVVGGLQRLRPGQAVRPQRVPMPADRRAAPAQLKQRQSTEW
jgi:multidrug efflux system membrane fusion protein